MSNQMMLLRYIGGVLLSVSSQTLTRRTTLRRVEDWSTSIPFCGTSLHPGLLFKLLDLFAGLAFAHTIGAYLFSSFTCHRCNVTGLLSCCFVFSSGPEVEDVSSRTSQLQSPK